MSSINQVLPIETLLQVLKSLGSQDMVKSRAICREWNQMLDETQSCWKEIALPQMNLFNTRSAVALFHSKSGSQLTKVSLIVRLEESEDINVRLLTNALFESFRTLQTISIHLIQTDTHPYYYDDPPRHLGGILLTHVSNLVEYRLFRKPFEWESCRLLFPMPPAVRAAEPGQRNSRLKVLCLPSFNIPGLSSLHFEDLASFTITEILHVKDYGLPKFLQKHSKTLKHLRLSSLDDQDFSETYFPLLEVLELDSLYPLDPDFPDWILAPPNLKVRAQQIPLIPSKVDFSSLWTSNVTNISRLSHSAPHLHTLRTQLSSAGLHSAEFESLLKALKGRRASYDINRRLEDINRSTRMAKREPVPLLTECELLKKLIIPFNQLNAQEITRLQAVVDLVVDAALEPDLWEVEI